MCASALTTEQIESMLPIAVVQHSAPKVKLVVVYSSLSVSIKAHSTRSSAAARTPMLTCGLILLQSLGLCAPVAVGLAGCAQTSTLSVATGTGPNPQLPAPVTTLIPTVNIATATGWPSGGGPVAADGTSVGRFADGLDHPRWIYVLPNGDVLVAETNAPPKPDDSKGIRGQIMNLIMKMAGAAAPSANRIILLRDIDHDGMAETKTVFLEGLKSPFGMALIGNNFYVANTDSIVRFPYIEGQTRIADSGTVVVELPAGSRNHHWTKNVVASADGNAMGRPVGVTIDKRGALLVADDVGNMIWRVSAAKAAAIAVAQTAPALSASVLR